MTLQRRVARTVAGFGALLAVTVLVAPLVGPTSISFRRAFDFSIPFADSIDPTHDYPTSDPVDETGLVHNLEHGGVVVQYGADVPDATVQEIARWYQEQSTQNGLVVAPIWPTIEASPPADAGKKIYLTAWTHLMTCPNFDKAAFDNFVDDYRGPSGDAPEKFPLDALTPGGQ